MNAAVRLIFLVMVSAGLAACATVPRGPDPQIERDAIAARMMGDIEALASDEFGGRKPGTPGGARTVAYMIDRMQQAGLKSGTNDPGSEWRAPVQLLSSKPLAHSITVRTSRGATVLPDEASAAFSLSSRVLIDGVEVVFVGNGARKLPKSELTGRIVVMVQKGSDTSARDAVFAASPAAVLAVVPNRVALERERRAFSVQKLRLASEASDQLTAFVTRAAFREVLGGGEWDALMAASSQPDFRSQRLRATIAIDATSQQRAFTSSNVIGLIPGQLPGSGAVLLMAHWDHLGECAPGTPDPICNGAVDNASGLALMLELAQRLKARGPHDRDIYFLATSAEEAGLLGAKAFAKAPPMPLDSITASFNFDSVAVARAGGAVGLVGEGRTPLDAVIQQVLNERGAELGNREFADSFLRRHDGWVLLEQGVPSVLLSSAFASEIVLGPFLATDYHRPGDEAQGLEMGGAVDDLLLHEALVSRVANTVTYPGTYPANNSGNYSGTNPVGETPASQ